MALEGRQDIRHNVPAGEDLTNWYYKFVQISSGTLSQPAAGGEGYLLVNKPDAAGKNGTIILMGKTKVEAGTGGMTAGVPVMIEDATGVAIDATATNYIVGTALETVAAGEVGMIFVNGIPTTF
jgi:hypothetical protein